MRKEIIDYFRNNKDEMIKSISELVGVPSVRGEAKEGMPFGEKPAEVLELALPAVVTATEALNHARYPSIKGLLKKDEVEIGNLTAADLPVDLARIGMKGSPTQVRQVRPVVPPKKENLRIEGKTTEEAADLFLSAMQKLKVI